MKLILDSGEEIEVNGELKEKLEDVFKENQYGEPCIGQECFVVCADSVVCITKYNGSDYNKNLYKNFKLFIDENVAEREAFREKVNNELLKFSYDHDGDKIDWSKPTCKYHISFNIDDNGIWWKCNTSTCEQGTVYFYSEEVVQQALDLFREDLIKYFTM